MAVIHIIIASDRPDLFARKTTLLQEAALARPLSIVARPVRTILSVPDTASQPDPVNVGLLEMPVDEFEGYAALFQFATNSDRSLPFAYSGNDKSAGESVVADKAFPNQLIERRIDLIRIEIPRCQLRA